MFPTHPEQALLGKTCLVQLYHLDSSLHSMVLPKVKEGQDMANNCAWCGDPGDENGSHSICDTHATELTEQLAARRAARQDTEKTEMVSSSTAASQEPASKA